MTNGRGMQGPRPHQVIVDEIPDEVLVEVNFSQLLRDLAKAEAECARLQPKVDTAVAQLEVAQKRRDELIRAREIVEPYLKEEP